ncbi:MAG: methyl-accepting chemotaxis protein [Pirellulaceae bacterium]
MNGPCDNAHMNTTDTQPDLISLSDTVANRVATELNRMCETTEEAALQIGRLLVQIVEIATEGNKATQETLCGVVKSSGDQDGSKSSQSITDLIDSQGHLITNFVEMTQSFFERQRTLTQEANEACQLIQKSARRVSSLVDSSRNLAFNIQIESARLGQSSRTFETLGKMIHEFSTEVASANTTIEAAVEQFIDSVPKLNKEATEMSQTASEFSVRLKSELTNVAQQSNQLTHTVRTVLDDTEQRNNSILACSQETLSHLQFQDPVAQGLKRASYEIRKLQKIWSGEHVDDVSLAELVDEVGNDGRLERDPGDVMMF